LMVEIGRRLAGSGKGSVRTHRNADGPDPGAGEILLGSWARWGRHLGNAGGDKARLCATTAATTASTATASTLSLGAFPSFLRVDWRQADHRHSQRSNDHLG